MAGVENKLKPEVGLMLKQDELIRSVEAYDAASKAREHLAAYGFRVQDAAKDFVEALKASPAALRATLVKATDATHG